MPLYDCLLLAKPHVSKQALVEMVGRIGSRVFLRNGVLTDIKSFGTIQLAYGIKKLDGRHFQGQLMQMTMMVPPTFNQELHYLNKEDRLLRWLVVKHRNTMYGQEFINEDEGTNELMHQKGGLFSKRTAADGDEDEDEDDDDDDDDGDEEYDLE
ncbi:uncharacterized protein LOC121981956 [Zingiber officinale]|uniref:Ribosomal protein S6 n=1 Tax=Zingiber officinale TaxID=94328 RepID=A0A8J5LCZ1_ZINOF|nr:uncharacterized protein LOC121981956 [Zingiber officinale]KAG6508567.1 hypothetical protein ZIOFF_033941 [Zingiber officinale]